MTPILANIIFPAFMAPFILPLLFPVAGIAALVTEFLCYRRLSTHPTRPGFGDVLGANILSGGVGFLISRFLPSGLVPKILPSGTRTVGPGPYFETYVVIAYVLACVLSIFIEGWFLRWSMRKEPEPVRGIYRMSAIANVASYLVLLVVARAWRAWFW
jgi:hypothetical protein